jgi:Carboxypeptidase regulatory-like domain
VAAIAAVATVGLAGCAGGSAASSGPHGTVEGRVLSAPSCPVQLVGSPCPPRAVVGATVVATRADRRVASTHTAAGGGFSLRLAPGRYLVTATNVGGFASTAASTVDVRLDTVARLTLTVDSGIR